MALSLDDYELNNDQSENLSILTFIRTFNLYFINLYFILSVDFWLKLHLISSWHE